MTGIATRGVAASGDQPDHEDEPRPPPGPPGQPGAERPAGQHRERQDEERLGGRPRRRAGRRWRRGRAAARTPHAGVRPPAAAANTSRPSRVASRPASTTASSARTARICSVEPVQDAVEVGGDADAGAEVGAADLQHRGQHPVRGAGVDATLVDPVPPGVAEASGEPADRRDAGRVGERSGAERLLGQRVLGAQHRRQAVPGRRRGIRWLEQAGHGQPQPLAVAPGDLQPRADPEAEHLGHLLRECQFDLSAGFRRRPATGDQTGLAPAGPPARRGPGWPAGRPAWRRRHGRLERSRRTSCPARSAAGAGTSGPGAPGSAGPPR